MLVQGIRRVVMTGRVWVARFPVMRGRFLKSSVVRAAPGILSGTGFPQRS